MPPETRRPLHSRAARARREWKAIEMTYHLSLIFIFLLFSLAAIIAIFVFQVPNWIIVIIVIVFVCFVAVMTIALGLFGQRRRMISRVRRHHRMHGRRNDVYTLPSLFHPMPPPNFPPMYTDHMRIPRPALLRAQRLLTVPVPPQYEQLFGVDAPFSPPPGPGAPPSYASMDRPSRRSADRASFSPPPGYEERREEEEGVEMIEMGEERNREDTVIEITEEIIEENNNEISTAIAPTIVKVIDCSKALPQLFEIPQHESLC